MKAFGVVIFVVLIGLSCIETNPMLQKASDFEFYYSYAGLGSGIGNIGPKFQVKGTSFTMLKDQNSYYGEKTIAPDTLCTGNVQLSTIDSVLWMIKDYQADSVHRVNPKIMSGGIHYISIQNDTTNLNFTLHNAWHPLAQKIIDLMNKDLPKDCYQLWLSKFDLDLEKTKD